MIGYIDDFLTTEQCEWFVWYNSVVPEGIDTGQRTRSMAFYDQPHFARKLSQLQGRVLLDEAITTVNMNFDYLPGGVHTDGYIDYDRQDRIAHSYLVPIVNDGFYSTVVFEQTSAAAVTLNNENGLGGAGIVNYPQSDRTAMGLTDAPFDSSIHTQYLSHLDYDSLRGLTVADIMNWALGCAMVWPRENFHASSNFTETEGRASILVTTRYND